ncbi:DUF6101 family protein [Aerobium aerolatum]|uniref:Uncharacterized protein n=1 Tax=Aquamicrobium aerolatum DSM 21857 TaxID=1121003 RepID=A0A1I3HM72_9HYPH|nr:DUF6101 family protein [Aquamicrobium aerolatum]SFI36709.1 hypothetical protein SAMN03080618_00259 [Aquamicrobium aerolatum DSM 21857]
MRDRNTGSQERQEGKTVTSTQLKPVWASSDMRLDPFRLPQAVSYASRDELGDVSFTIDPRGATVRRLLQQSGLPVTVVVPATAFRGVAARAIEHEGGTVTVTLELLHNDPHLSVPLLVASDLDDVAADWRAWAEAYRLPMLLFEADGVARTLDETLGMVRTGQPVERRKGRVSRQRRPRFLARRRTGDLGLRLVVDGEEIIARN